MRLGPGEETSSLETLILRKEDKIEEMGKGGQVVGAGIYARDGSGRGTITAMTVLMGRKTAVPTFFLLFRHSTARSFASTFDRNRWL